MEHSLDDDLRAIEAQLAELAPQTMPGDLLARMDRLMGGWEDSKSVLTVVDSEEDHELKILEGQLSQLSPVALPDEMLSRMTHAMDRWQDHASEEGNVVSIHHQSPSAPRVFNKGMLKAAAAVALLGAASALLMPPLTSNHDKPTSMAGRSGSPSTSGLNSSTAHQVSSLPVSPYFSGMGGDHLSHQVTRTSDGGVVFASDNKPLRCIRVDYIDSIKGKDAEGRDIEIKNPGVDFMFIPVETN